LIDSALQISFLAKLSNNVAILFLLDSFMEFDDAGMPTLLENANFFVDEVLEVSGA
jgi:hypothetical protein